MSKIDFDNLLNPVGSVHHNAYGYSGLDDREFDYSANNPAMELINGMLKNERYHPEDVADLYDQAAQWEIDRSNWLDQLKVDQAIKEEQREYDSPLQQVARAREAGINLDIAGNGSSSISQGSAGNVQGAGADNNPLIGNTDNYAGKYYALAAVDTASNFVQGLANTTSQILGSVAQYKLLPSQINLNEAQAGLMDAQAGEINALLDGKKKSLDLSNTNQYLGQLADLSALINPDATDEEFTNTLGGLGLTEEQIPSAMGVIRQFHKDPNLLARFNRGKLENRWTEAENATYTEDIVYEMVDLEKRTNLLQKQLDFDTTSLQSKIASLLNTDEYANDNAQFLKDSLEYSQDELELEGQKLAFDTEQYLVRLQERAKVLDYIDGKRAELRKEPQTPANKAKLERLDKEYMVVKTMLANEFYKVEESFINVAQQMYHKSYTVGEDGGLIPASRLEVPNMFNESTFNDLIHHTRTPGEIAQGWTNSALDVGKTVALSVVGFKGAKGISKMTRGKSGSMNYKFNKKTQSWNPVSYTTSTNQSVTQ